MKREEFEHLVRALTAITNETEFVAIGSQAALATSGHLPKVMSHSPELDVYVPGKPHLSDVIDGSIGEGSPFHSTFGYYAQGVGPETAKLPASWRQRARELRTEATGGAHVVAPEINDLCISKLIAGREKDLAYVQAARKAGLLKLPLLPDRLAEVPDLDPHVRARVSSWIATELGTTRRRPDQSEP